MGGVVGAGVGGADGLALRRRPRRAQGAVAVARPRGARRARDSARRRRRRGCQVSVRNIALPFAAVLALMVGSAAASGGTMAAYPAEDYPSLSAAIDGLAGAAADAITSRDGAGVTRVAVSGAAPAEHLRRAGEAVVKRLPGSGYTLRAASASAGAPDDAAAIEIDVKDLGRSAVPWQAAPAAHGTVSLSVVAGDGRRSFSARFQEKPWGDDFAAFSNANPDRRWVVGRTGRPWGSQAEASADALASAADALAPA